MGLSIFLHMLLIFTWYFLAFYTSCKKVSIKFSHAPKTCSLIQVFKFLCIKLWIAARIERRPQINGWCCRRSWLFCTMDWKTLWDIISIETLRYVYFISSLVDSTFLAGVWATLSNVIFAIYLFQNPLKTNLCTTCSFLFTWLVLWLSFSTEYSFMYLLYLENLVKAWTLFQRKRFILCDFSLIIVPKRRIESQRIV